MCVLQSRRERTIEIVPIIQGIAQRNMRGIMDASCSQAE